MKKILFLANHDYSIYNTRLELIEQFISRGDEVHISSPEGERTPDLIALGCIFHKTPINRHGMNLFEEFQLIKKYEQLFSKIRPDVILGYTIKPNIYGAIAAKKNKIPFIANITGLGTAVETPSWKQRLFIELYRYAFRNIYYIYFQNTENRDFFLRHKLVQGNYGILPGSGVNLERFPYQEYIDSVPIRFAFISRVMREKGIDQFLTTAEHIRSKFDNTEFNIYGFCEQSYEGKIKEFETRGIVNYHGKNQNISEVLKNSHCLLHPSFYPEGLSNVLLEACATGRPIITTNRAGCREVVEHGINGYIVKQEDSNDLIAKVEQFLNLSLSEKSILGKNARRKVETEFDRRIVVNEYIRLIDAI